MANVTECCHGKTVNHMGYGRCAADQGGRSIEIELNFDGESATDVIVDGVTHRAFELDPSDVGMDCITMMDCLMSTDPCGVQIPSNGFSIRHLKTGDDTTVRLIVESTPTGERTIIPAGTSFWLRVYGF